MSPVPSRLIEERALRAWPPEETHELEGWRFHASGGFSRRANSAAPSSSTDMVEEAIDGASRWYGERGLPLVVRITPGSVAVDSELDRLGFTKEGVTDVMTALAAASGSSAGSDTEVVIDREPGVEWLTHQADLQGVPDAQRASWSGIIRRIEPRAAFALVRDGGDIAGAGLAVCDRGWVGLFEINVAAESRRRGHGRALSRALMAWGAAMGAESAYLQVVADNLPARALYRSLGFEPAYRYWYRRAPDALLG